MRKEGIHKLLSLPPKELEEIAAKDKKTAVLVTLGSGIWTTVTISYSKTVYARKNMLENPEYRQIISQYRNRDPYKLVDLAAQLAIFVKTIFPF